MCSTEGPGLFASIFVVAVDRATWGFAKGGFLWSDKALANGQIQCLDISPRSQLMSHAEFQAAHVVLGSVSENAR